ncbi:hypothetical protein GCM10009639_17330 [Kitasatospora putterlickiae]|uniref:Uncharacterized protein n=1 Tax=Kitasatospora putterlickiae TaxID=221725 RepID=A0ABN1XT71_9ACTN
MPTVANRRRLTDACSFAGLARVLPAVAGVGCVPVQPGAAAAVALRRGGARGIRS